jgi:beta-glucosidase
LDQEQPDQFFFGNQLKKAVGDGEVSQDEINDHVHRILRTIFATGLYDHPVVDEVPDVERGYALAQRIAEKSIVLLKNEHVLPLDAAGLHSLVLIGGHADVGVITGGGSAQVDAPGGSAVPPPPPGANPLDAFIHAEWLPSSPPR